MCVCCIINVISRWNRGNLLWIGNFSREKKFGLQNFDEKSDDVPAGF